MIPDDSGPHRFGGDANDYDIRGLPPGAQLHHIATIDLSDPNCPIQVEDVDLQVFPLFYPLKDDGGQVQYSLYPQRVVEIHSHSNSLGMEFNPGTLPRRRFRLHRLEYEEERLLRALDSHFRPAKLTPDDQRISVLLSGGDPWRVGGYFETVQGPVWETCLNPQCTWRDRFGKAAISPIALISASTIPYGKIWDDWPEDVQFFFGYCPHCNAIQAQNRCT